MVSKKSGFISGSLIVLMFVLMGISVSLLSLANLASEKALFDLNNMKAELIFEEYVIKTRLGIEIDNELLDRLPVGYFIDKDEITQNNVSRVNITLRRKLDIKGSAWVRRKE